MVAAGPFQELSHTSALARSGLILLIALMVVVGGWVVLSRQQPPTTAWLVFLGLFAVWIVADQRVEGSVLITFTRAHGLTQGDLIAPVIAAVAYTLRWGRLIYQHQTAGSGVHAAHRR